MARTTRNSDQCFSMFFLYLTSCKVARKRIALIIAVLFKNKSSQNDRNMSKEVDDIFDPLLCRSRSHKLWPMSLGPVRAAGLKRRRSVAAWRPRSCAKFLKLSPLITGKYRGYEVVCTCRSCNLFGLSIITPASMICRNPMEHGQLCQIQGCLKSKAQQVGRHQYNVIHEPVQSKHVVNK